MTEWFSWANQQQVHGQPLEIGQFLWALGQSTFENWQSEFLQLFAFVVLSALLIHRGRPESRDADQGIVDALGRIERRLETLELDRGAEVEAGRR